MHWVIQNNLYSEEGYASLIDALERQGVSYSVHKCVPFVGTLEPDCTPPPGQVVVMGSYTLAVAAQKRGWTPGVFLNDNFDFRVQIKHWGDAMLNSDSIVCALKDVPEQIYPFFMRPVLDSKSFTGEVTDWPSFVEWRDRVLALRPEDGATVTGETLVQVCSKKEIYSETRTWIVDGRVVTASGYKLGTRRLKNYLPECDPIIALFAETQAAIWSPHRAYCLDVADTPDGLKIIEVNNLNSAGFYAANMGKLLHAIETMPTPMEVLKIYEETAASVVESHRRPSRR